MEYTYVMIKPDGVKRRLVGEVISRLERKGYQVCTIEMGMATKEVLEAHYAHLKDKPFFPGLVDFMTSGPMVKMVVAGHDVVAGVRKILGETDPTKAQVGTIRGDLANCVGRNVCHASDTVENAVHEVKLWMAIEKPTIPEMMDSAWIYE